MPSAGNDAGNGRRQGVPRSHRRGLTSACTAFASPCFVARGRADAHCRFRCVSAPATRVQGKPVVFDGAMGSSLYEQGILHTRAFEECNITAAAKVKAVHLAFIEAGANVIETNTFAANKFALGRYGLQNVAEINHAGVEIAKEAVAESGKGAWVAGAVGPTGEGAGFLDDDKAEEIKEVRHIFTTRIAWQCVGTFWACHI